MAGGRTLAQRRSVLNAALLLVGAGSLCLLAQEALPQAEETTRPRRLGAHAEHDLAQSPAALDGPPPHARQPGGHEFQDFDGLTEMYEVKKCEAKCTTAAPTPDDDEHDDKTCWRNMFMLEVHGKGGVRKVGKVTLTTSWLLIGSLGLSMVGLYLVNWDDAQVRNYIWNLISSTISIFLAVGINHAFQQFIFVQIIASPRPRGLGICDLDHFYKKAIQFAILVVSGASVSLSCYLGERYQDPHWQHAASSICGHIHGFAGIVLFGLWQQNHEAGNDGPGGPEERADVRAPPSQVFGVALGAFVTATILTGLRFHLLYPLIAWMGPSDADRSPREHAGAAPGYAYRSMPMTQQGERGPDTTELLAERAATGDEVVQTPVPRTPVPNQERWRHLALETEIEANSMYLSFCTSQCLLRMVLGHMAPMHYTDKHYSVEDYGGCCNLTLGIFALLMVGTWIRLKASRAGLLDLDETRRSRAEQCAEWLQMYTTMTMIWVLLRFFVWRVKAWMPDSPDMVQVVNAGLVTLIGVVSIIIIDHVADRLDVLHKEDNESNRHQSNGASAATAAHEMDVLPEAKQMGKALRALIEGIGLLVGVSWERAFEAANYGIVDGTPTLQDRPVMSFMALMVILVVVVTPAWKKYIVPMAMMHWEQHEHAMTLEKCRADFAWGNYHQEHVFVMLSKDWSDEQVVAVLVACARHRKWASKPEGWLEKIKVELEKPYFKSDAGRQAKLFSRSKSRNSMTGSFTAA